MILLLRHFIGWMVGVFGSREDLILENLALRQQLLALHSKRPRHRLSTMHKLFWIALRRLWSEWKAPLILVTTPVGCVDVMTTIPSELARSFASVCQHPTLQSCPPSGHQWRL